MNNGAPTGVGWWVWEMPRALCGRAYEQFAADLLAAGISYVLVKAGDANNRWSQFSDCVGPLQAAGLRVLAWTYVYAGNPPRTAQYSPESTSAGEAAVAISALQAGADGLVLDIEAEAEGRHAAQEEIWQHIRAAHPDVWIGWSPHPVIDYHDPDSYRIACRYASAHLPMMYLPSFDYPWNDFDRVVGLWERWLAQWEREGLPRLPLMPIGQACERASAQDIADFAARCRAEGFPSISWWELSQASAAQWEAVAQAAGAWGEVDNMTEEQRQAVLDACRHLWAVASELDRKRHKGIADTVRNDVAAVKQATGLKDVP